MRLERYGAIFLIACLRKVEILVCLGRTYTLSKMLGMPNLLQGLSALSREGITQSCQGTWRENGAHSTGGSGPVQVRVAEPTGARIPFPIADLRHVHGPPALRAAFIPLP